MSIFFTVCMIALAGVLTHSMAQAEPGEVPKPKPNIIFIICDDLNDAIGEHGRIPSAPTPHIDRLRAKGVTFTNAAANSPICLPSRNSLLSGLHPRTSGHYRLNDDPASNPVLRAATFLPEWLRSQGYQTFGAGKVFHAGGVPYRSGHPERFWDEFSGGPNYGPFPYDPAFPRPIQRLRIHPRQAWLLEHPDRSSLEEEYHDPFWMLGEDGMRFAFENGFAPIEDVPPGGWVHDSKGTPFRFESSEDRDLLEDEQTTRFAMDVLAREHSAPFFLAVGYIRPHTPLYVPQRFFDRFPPESLQLPPIRDDELTEVASAHAGHRPYGRLRWELLRLGGEALWREWLQAYLASIAFMDAELGQLLDALEASPYAEDTIVIFTSDNGYHMGDKDSLFKDTLWEGSCRVPLIWAGPGIAQGRRSEEPTSLLDIYPTLVDFIGASAVSPLDGASIRSHLKRPSMVTSDGLVINVSAVRGLTGTHFAARSSTHRYILCENGEEELYDHRNDPLEHHNLAAQREHAEVKARLRRALESHLAKYDETREAMASQTSSR